MVVVGDNAPDFTLLDQRGNEFHLANVLGSHHIVLYFYPKDFTLGCTKESCYFRDEYEEFDSRNARIIGISSDSVGSHQRFASEFGLQFELLSDPGAKVRKLYRVSASFGLIPGRTTVIIDRSGMVREVFSSQHKFSAHVDVALRTIRELEAEISSQRGM